MESLISNYNIHKDQEKIKDCLKKSSSCSDQDLKERIKKLKDEYETKFINKYELLDKENIYKTSEDYAENHFCNFLNDLSLKIASSKKNNTEALDLLKQIKEIEHEEKCKN